MTHSTPITKTCPACKTSKPLSDFGRNVYSKDGLNHYCKPCNSKKGIQWKKDHPATTKAQQQRYRAKRDPEVKRAYALDYNKAHPEQKRSYKKSWEAANPHKLKAHTALQYAIKSGKISRGSCCVCGKPKAHGHHEDYTKPYVVIWLCNFHHHQHHIKPTKFVLRHQIDYTEACARKILIRPLFPSGYQRRAPE